MKTLLPGYTWPGNDAVWDRLLALPPGIAVINPASGPGTSRSPLWTSRIAQLVERGWQLTAYVATHYLQRPLLDMTREVTAYRSWYPPVTGVFYDEWPSSGVGVLEAGVLLEQMATRLGGPCIVNPGVEVPGRWFGVLAKTIIVTYEGPADVYRRAPLGFANEAHIVYACPDPAPTITAPWGYTTWDDIPNPWDGE
jgi:hypothetical protein